MLIAADVILWDEAPMPSKMCLGGDFRQPLLIAPHQARSGIVSKTIQKTNWWSKVHIIRLHINERVRKNGDNVEAQNFARFLLDVGEGKLPYHPELGLNMVQIPDKYIFHSQDTASFIE